MARTSSKKRLLLFFIILKKKRKYYHDGKIHAESAQFNIQKVYIYTIRRKNERALNNETKFVCNKKITIKVFGDYEKNSEVVHTQVYRESVIMI